MFGENWDLKKIFGYLGRAWGWVVAVCSLFGALIGFIANDYLSFTAEYRKAIAEQYDQVKTASVKVDADLNSFASLALGNRAELSQQTRDSFRNNMIALYNSTQRSVKLMPRTQPEAEKYMKTISDLTNSAIALKGPADGRKFVEDFSAYMVAKKEFQDKVDEERGRYFSSLFRSIRG